MRRTTLTPKQSAFVREYLVDHNGTQAAIRAGYSPSSARTAAGELLAHPVIHGHLAREAGARQDRLELQADQTLERWRRIAGVTVQALVDPVTGEPKRFCELPADVAYCVEAYELDEQGRIVKAKMYSKIDALKFLSKHLQLAHDVPDVLVQPMTVNHTEIFLGSLSTEELKVIERVLVRAEAAKALPAPSTDTPQ